MSCLCAEISVSLGRPSLQTPFCSSLAACVFTVTLSGGPVWFGSRSGWGALVLGIVQHCSQGPGSTPVPSALAKTSFHIVPALSGPYQVPERSRHGREGIMVGIVLDFYVCCVQLLKGWAGWGRANRRGRCLCRKLGVSLRNSRKR